MIQKTKILTLIVFGLLFLNLSAQEGDYSNDPIAKLPDDDRKFRFGLQFSPNISWLKTNRTGYSSEGSKFGYSYGLSFEYFMTKNYLFSTGLSVLNTGGKLRYNLLLGDYEIKYVEVPLLLKLRTNEIGYLTYYGQFGFMTGFNINSSADFGSGVFVTNDAISSETNFMNVSLAIGIGVEYNISGNTSLNTGIIFSNGFVDQFDGDASGNLNYVALNIGIFF